MTGNIYHELLEFHEGAQFEGRVRHVGARPAKPVTRGGAEAFSRPSAWAGALAGTA